MFGMKLDRATAEGRGLELLGEALISRRGEASGVAMAQSLLASFEQADEPRRLRFLSSLAERFGPDHQAIELAIAAYQRKEDGDPTTVALHIAAEPRRQELIRRLNLTHALANLQTMT